MSYNRCVIIAAGQIDCENRIKAEITVSDFIIAADAGYRHCMRMGLKPNLIVGDFDSACAPNETDAEVLRLNPIKDATDSETALIQAEQRGFSEILFFGATGGRLDHTFANLTLVAAAKQRGVSVTVFDAQHKIFALKEETRRIEKDEYKYLSVFAFGGDCIVSEKGVFYPLDRYMLSPCCALGVSNEITASLAEITVHFGTAILIQAEEKEGV